MPNGQSQLVAPSQLPPRSQVPNCYTLVMLRQASKLLIRLLDPSFVINTCVAAPHHQHLHIQQQVVSSSYPPQESKDLSPSRRPHDYRYQQPTPEEEKRAAMALKRAQSSMESGEDGAEVRHWYDYLARYLLIPGCWTAGPVPANLLARVRPVFLYKNLRRCVNKMMTQAIERRKQEIITTGDPQPEEVGFLNHVLLPSLNFTPVLSFPIDVLDCTQDYCPAIGTISRVVGLVCQGANGHKQESRCFRGTRFETIWRRAPS